MSAQKPSAIQLADRTGNAGGADIASPSAASPEHATASPALPPLQPLATLPPPLNAVAPQPSGGPPPAKPEDASAKPPAATDKKDPPPKKQVTEEQKRLIATILHADVAKIRRDFVKTDWNFVMRVVGRTSEQSPLALLLRPELNYGNLSRMTSNDQYNLVKHVLQLPEGITPRLDWIEAKKTINLHVLQAVYQGRVELFQLCHEASIDRARQSTGVEFNLRETYFPSKLTLLHMAAHDGRLEMAKWIVSKWADLAEKDPNAPESRLFTPDIPDAGGQTPLFWCFARGNVNVDLARYFVEECGCDFFQVFTLKSNDGSHVVGKVSAFSLAIQLAPAFAEEQLRKKTENMGTRFHLSVMKNDFNGITVTPEQISAMQSLVDKLNAAASEAQPTAVIEGKVFLEDATRRLKEHVLANKAANNGVVRMEYSGFDKTGKTVTRNDVDVAELRFVSQEAPGDRKPKQGWDNFFYDSHPLSAIELMIKHDRKSLLMTPIMVEVQERLWKHLAARYYIILGCYLLFGVLYSINTALWPRTAILLGRNIPLSLPAGVDNDVWVGFYFVNNLICILLCIALAVFHCSAIYQGYKNARPKSEPKQSGGDSKTATSGAATAPPANKPADNKPEDKKTPSEKAQATATAVAKSLVTPVQFFLSQINSWLDVSIMTVFIVVQFLQWSLLCHVPQFASQALCDGYRGVDIVDLNEDHLSAYGWLAAFLHLLLGMKILELVSIFSFAGPLLSTLIGMFRDVAKFMILFGIGYCAFTCALWIVLRDIYMGPPTGLDGMAQYAASTGSPYAEAEYSYTDSMIHVLLWVFLNFDFSEFDHTTLVGIAPLGRILFLAFLLIMVLVMLNLMIAMFSNTYSDVVKDAKGEWHIRYSSVLCQLLRMAGPDAIVAADFIMEMGVNNNCGIDRPQSDINVETGTSSKQGGTNWAETIYSQFQSLHQTIARLRSEVKDLKTSVKRVQEANQKLANLSQAKMPVDLALAGPTVAPPTSSGSRPPTAVVEQKQQS